MKAKTQELLGKVNKAFAFCDIYNFSEFKNPQITKMKSYVIEVDK